MLTEDQKAHLSSGAEQLGIKLDKTQIDQSDRFAGLLYDWNQRLNLTRIPIEDVVPLHFLDSLTVAAAFDLKPGFRLIDVGTGAGFPGIPIRIAFPHLEVTLLDSTRKRLTFLDAAISELGLTNIRTIHARAEEAAALPEHRAAYDVAVARAVAPMDRLAGWLLPLIKKDGWAVALKSAGAEREIEQSAKEIRKAGAGELRIVGVRIPRSEIDRLVVVISKR